jgi:hypothetical protein
VSEAGARAEILNEAKDSVQDFVISSFSLAMLSEFGQKFFCAFEILDAKIQMAVAVIPHRITDECIAFQAPGIDSRQHRDVRINIVVDSDNTLCVMKSVETPPRIAVAFPSRKWASPEVISPSIQLLALNAPLLSIR